MDVTMGFRLLATDFWYREMPGSILLAMERDLISKMISHIHGNYLIQLGSTSDLSLVKSSPIKHKFYLSQQKNFLNQGAKIVADIEQLPFMTGSIDVAVLAHVLEFVKKPEKIVSQIYDLLVPNGYCIILGFNYWSLWSLGRLYQHGEFPWQGHFFSTLTIKRWLRRNHFRIITSKTACFRPPVHAHNLAKSLLFMEPIGQFFLPGCGGFYMVVAQKRVFAARPEMDQTWWKKYTINQSSYAKPTTRNM